MRTHDRLPPGHGTWTTFRVPLAVAGLSLTGLVGALLADGAWDYVGAALLASTLAVLTWALAARRR